MATSASSFNSRRSQRRSPNSPCSAKAGARLRLDRKRALPLPPSPAAAASQRSPWADRSASCEWSPWSRTTVPTGTFTSRSAPPGPVAVVARAVLAVGRPAVGVVAEGQQGGDVAVGHQPDVSPASAVAARRSAPGHVGLPAEGHAPGPAVTRSDMKVALVDEAGHPLRLGPTRTGSPGLPKPASPAANSQTGPGHHANWQPRTPKTASSAANSYSVRRAGGPWSGFGWDYLDQLAAVAGAEAPPRRRPWRTACRRRRAPRWRRDGSSCPAGARMIAPARTRPPSYTFTPRRCAFESRPVAGGASALGLGHVESALPDVGDLEGGQRLAVAPPAPLVALGLVGEAADLGAAVLVHDHRGHAGAGEVGPA